MKSPSARRPVFLDSTGRRHRAIRRTGLVLAVPVAGYLVLMVSSLFGGPRLDTPLVPLPEAIVRPEQQRKVTPPPAAIQTIEPAATPTPARESEPATTPSTSPTSTPTTTPPGTPTVVPTTATVTPAAHTTGSPTAPPGKPTATPTPTSTTTHPGHKPTVPPGRTKTPAKP